MTLASKYNIKALIFDFDGVIVDSVKIKTNAFAELFKKEGKEIVAKVISYHLNNTGVSRYEKFKHIYKEILKRELSEDGFQKLCYKFENLVIGNVIKAPYMRGADEFLKKYVQKYIFFLVSATPQKEIEKITEERNIDKFFRRIYGAPTKKNDAVKEIIIENNFSIYEVVYVGDSLADYRAAKDNSVKFVAFVNGNNHSFNRISSLKIRNYEGLIGVLNEQNE